MISYQDVAWTIAIAIAGLATVTLISRFIYWLIIVMIHLAGSIYANMVQRTMEVVIMASPTLVKEAIEETMGIDKRPWHIRFLGVLNEAWEEYPWLVPAASLCVGLLLLIALKRLIGFWVAVMFEELIFKLRGIQYESVRAGSSIDSKPEPSFQVEIVDVGLFTTVHIGHGIRVGNILVVPQHVKQAVASRPALRKNGKIHFISWTGIDSRILRDTFYLVVNEVVWSTLGVSRAPTAHKVRKVTPVSISSEGKGSEGIITPSSTPGWINYNGSTLPGFSGAAYFTGNAWVGQHTGSLLTGNCGVPAFVIEAEVAKIMIRESPNDDYGDYLKGSKNKQWYEEDVSVMVDKAYEDDEEYEWDEDYGMVRYNKEKLRKGYYRVSSKPSPGVGSHWDTIDVGAGSWAAELEEESARMTPSQIKNLVKQSENLTEKLKARMVLKALEATQAVETIKSQAPTGATVEMEPVPIWNTTMKKVDRVTHLGTYFMDRVNSLEKTVELAIEKNQALEIKVNKLEEKINQGAIKKQVIVRENVIQAEAPESAPVEPQLKEKFDRTLVNKKTCSICKKQFSTNRAAKQHRLDSHIRPESALVMDSKKLIKTGNKPNFLGKSSQKESSKTSENTSNLKVKTSPFTELLESQKLIQLSLQKLLQNLNPIQKDTAGQTLATVQN